MTDVKDEKRMKGSSLRKKVDGSAADREEETRS
jgi:hypothetical protein